MKVLDLSQKHVALAKENLRIGRCFGVLVRFSERIAAYRGIEALDFVIERSGDDVVYAGSLAISVSEKSAGVVIGSWSVFPEGKMTIKVGEVLLENEDADPMERSLNQAWMQGDFRRALNKAHSLGAC